MSWAEIKKAVNSDLSTSLDVQTISAMALNSYEMFGSDSLLLNDAYYLDKLFQSPNFVSALTDDSLYEFINFASNAGILNEFMDLKYGITTDATTLTEFSADTSNLLTFLGEFDSSELTDLHTATSLGNLIYTNNSDVVSQGLTSATGSATTISSSASTSQKSSVISVDDGYIVYISCTSKALTVCSYANQTMKLSSYAYIGGSSVTSGSTTVYINSSSSGVTYTKSVYTSYLTSASDNCYAYAIATNSGTSSSSGTTQSYKVTLTAYGTVYYLPSS